MDAYGNPMCPVAETLLQRDLVFASTNFTELLPFFFFFFYVLSWIEDSGTTRVQINLNSTNTNHKPGSLISQGQGNVSNCFHKWGNSF